MVYDSIMSVLLANYYKHFTRVKFLRTITEYYQNPKFHYTKMVLALNSLRGVVWNSFERVFVRLSLVYVWNLAIYNSIQYMQV